MVDTPDNRRDSADYSQFSGQRLNRIDEKLGHLSESQIRLETKLDGLHSKIEDLDARLSKRLESLDSKMSSVEKKLIWATAAFVSAVAIVGALVGLWKLIEPHIAITLK